MWLSINLICVKCVRVPPNRLRLDGGSVESSWTTTDTTIYLGHQAYEAHRYVPGAMHYLILARDPVDQFISSFYYKNPVEYTNDTDAGTPRLLVLFSLSLF